MWGTPAQLNQARFMRVENNHVNVGQHFQRAVRGKFTSKCEIHFLFPNINMEDSHAQICRLRCAIFYKKTAVTWNYSTSTAVFTLVMWLEKKKLNKRFTQ